MRPAMTASGGHFVDDDARGLVAEVCAPRGLAEGAVPPGHFDALTPLRRNTRSTSLSPNVSTTLSNAMIEGRKRQRSRRWRRGRKELH